MAETLTKAKPFLKWVGGKRQLIDQIDRYLPEELKNGEIKRYVEPFIGGGSLFFYVSQMYDIQEFVINDVNEELILVYNVIKKNVDALIAELKSIEIDYWRLTLEQQNVFFYDMRAKFNEKKTQINDEHFHEEWVERAAQVIFLNRTCFNGLFRVNSKGGFNVPFGKNKKPTICAESNLRAVSRVLQKALILCGDFENIAPYINEKTFVYFDPPYRPISKTASFTAYAKSSFNDDEQLRLASFYNELDEKSALLMLSNSDPKNENSEDDFFEVAYAGHHIESVSASRMINSVSTKRGAINELLIRNYA